MTRKTQQKKLYGFSQTLKDGEKMSKYSYYEAMKKKIAKESKTPQEYEKRVKALAKKLNI